MSWSSSDICVTPASILFWTGNAISITTPAPTTNPAVQVSRYFTNLDGTTGVILPSPGVAPGATLFFRKRFLRFYHPNQQLQHGLICLFYERRKFFTRYSGKRGKRGLVGFNFFQRL